MSNKLLIKSSYNYLENPIIMSYFNLKEKSCYFHSLKKANDRRDFYKEMIPCSSSFIELSKREEALKQLDEFVFSNINKMTYNTSGNLIKILRSVNKEGFDLMKIKGPLNFDTLKKFYLTAVKLYHPDLGGDTHKVQIINEAYSQFHEVIANENNIDRNVNENDILIKTAEDYVNHAYVDIIDILVDSWNMDGAYRYLKEAIDRGIFNEFPRDSYNNFECIMCIKVCERIINIDFDKKVLAEFVNYAEACIRNMNGLAKEIYIKRINELKDRLEKDIKYRVVISHNVQAENAKRLGLITDKKYHEYINKLKKIDSEKKELYAEAENILSVSSFIVPLENEKRLFNKLIKHRSESLIPQTNYFQCNIYDLSKVQQWEYFKAFSDKADIKLINKYIFVRLYSYLNSVYGNFSEELCIEVLNELKSINNIFKWDNSIQYYYGKVIESFNMLLSMDEKESSNRIKLIKMYCTQENSILDTPITNSFMEFINEDTEKMELVVNGNINYNLMSHYDMIERRKLDEEFLNLLKEDEENAWLAIRGLKKTDLNKACEYIETYVVKGLEVIEKLHAPEWFDITFWIEELCKINTRLHRSDNSIHYLKAFFELPYDRRGRTGAGIIKRLEERYIKLNKM